MSKQRYAGMDLRKSKAESLYLKDKDWWQGEENQNKGAVFFDSVHFGMIPVELLRDPKIKPQAKAVYGLMHSYSQPKKLINKPQTFVSQQRLAEESGLSVDRIRYWQKVLEQKGWMKSLRRGLNKTNYYILYARKKKRKGAK